MNKDLKGKAISIKGKDYVLVSDRVLYFNEKYPNGSITTSLVTDAESDLIVIKAFVYPDVAVSERCFTGYSQAIKGDGFINKTAALENAETSAVGRALGMMGIGVIESIASGDEINKAQGSEGKRKGATDKQIEWMRNTVQQLTGLEHSEDIDEEIAKILTIKPQDVPIGKVKDAVDKIKEVINASDDADRKTLGDIPY